MGNAEGENPGSGCPERSFLTHGGDRHTQLKCNTTWNAVDGNVQVQVLKGTISSDPGIQEVFKEQMALEGDRDRWLEPYRRMGEEGRREGNSGRKTSPQEGLGV